MSDKELDAGLEKESLLSRVKKILKEREKKIQELNKAKTETEEARNVLEIKVQARTQELAELAKSLEAQVKERTKELEEKIAELERFQRLAVGRELKMIDLKKEIKKLKGESEKKNGGKK